MRLIDELRAEHTLIDRVLGSLRTWVELGGDATDGPAFVRFFRRFAGEFHHAREEDTLFVALHREVELPLQRGPLQVLTAEHRELAAVLDALEPLLHAAERGPRMTALATEYSRGLWHHLDAENSVMLPEAEERLRAKNVRELEGRAPTEAELAARAEGERLAARYEAWRDDGLRGEGCIMCPAYGERCRGLEREWWSDAEWDESAQRAASGE